MQALLAVYAEGMHRLLAVLFVLVLVGASQEAAGPIRPGQIIASVQCADDAKQSYALYLPKAYTSSKKWPVILAFDPFGSGHQPVEKMKDLAEEFGYIVAASNNSRNGPLKPQLEAVNAVWRDVRQRFAVDEGRLFTTGLSGAGRLAATVAQLCKTCVLGVFSQGAGFPQTRPPTADIKFSYFVSVGDADFNHPEVLQLSKQLEQLHVAHREREFSGGHQWAPPDVWREAFGWMELQAMKQGRRSKDEKFISAQLNALLQRAESEDKAGKHYPAYKEYETVAREFKGLADVSQAEVQAAQLKNTKAVKDGMKRELADIDLQANLTGPPYQELETIANQPSERNDALPRLTTYVTNLKRRTEEAKAKHKDDPNTLVLRRALNQIFVQAWESGERSLLQNNYGGALAQFEFLTSTFPDAAVGYVNKARVYAVTHDEKKAIANLKQAVAKGLDDAEVLQSSPELAELKKLPEFQQIITEISQKK